MLYAGIALGGSAGYAVSFRFVYGEGRIVTMSQAAAVSAGLAWVIFGAMLLLITRCRPSVLAWADACLGTMVPGIAALTVSIVFNLLSPGWTAPGRPIQPLSLFVHSGILLAANLLMARLFIRRAKRLGLRGGEAAVLWFVVQNGLFVLIFWWVLHWQWRIAA